MLEQSPLFKNADPLLLNTAIMAIHPRVVAAGVEIVKKGESADEMYLICRGKVEIIDDTGTVISTLGDGEFFGEIGLLMSIPRTATVSKRKPCAISLCCSGAILCISSRIIHSLRKTLRR
jgi:CRP-like cAMP-binding protein